MWTAYEVPFDIVRLISVSLTLAEKKGTGKDAYATTKQCGRRTKRRPTLSGCQACLKFRLLQKLEHRIGTLICLSQHGGARLDEDVVTGELSALLGNVHILDAAVCG